MPGINIKRRNKKEKMDHPKVTKIGQNKEKRGCAQARPTRILLQIIKYNTLMVSLNLNTGLYISVEGTGIKPFPVLIQDQNQKYFPSQLINIGCQPITAPTPANQYQAE